MEINKQLNIINFTNTINNKYEQKKIKTADENEMGMSALILIPSCFESSPKRTLASSPEKVNSAYVCYVDLQHNHEVPNSTHKFAVVGLEVAPDVIVRGNLNMADYQADQTDLTTSVKSCIKHQSSPPTSNDVTETTPTKKVRFVVYQQQAKEQIAECQVHSCKKCKANPLLLVDFDGKHGKSYVVPAFAKRLRTFFTRSGSNSLNDSSSPIKCKKSKLSKLERSSSYVRLDDAADNITLIHDSDNEE